MMNADQQMPTQQDIERAQALLQHVQNQQTPLPNAEDIQHAQAILQHVQAQQQPLPNDDDLTDPETTIASGIASVLTHLKQKSRAEERNQRLANIAGHIEKCDGLSEQATREWMKGMQIAQQMTNNIDGNIMRLVNRTTTGGMYRNLQTWMQGRVVTWLSLSQYVRNHYLGSNEEERLKIELSKYRQANTPIMVHNRKFKELAYDAYPCDSQDGGTRLPATEKILVQCYIRSLADKQLAQRILIENQTQSLEVAIDYVDRLSANMELFSVITDEPMDCSAIANRPPDEDKTNYKLVAEKQNTKIAKLEAQLAEMRKTQQNGGGRQNGRQNGMRGQNGAGGHGNGYKKPFSCYNCGKPGHMSRECRSPKKPQGQGQPDQRQGNRQHLN